jgi:hypothetical protein
VDNGGYIDQLKHMGASNVRLDTESAVDTMDFVNKIVNGKTRPGELPSKSSINRGQSATSINNGKRLADKLDSAYDFNFPVIPPYEGVQ